ncbi:MULTISPECIES: hypothetical protein [Chromobacterium]|uniref:hypothetical protein n=1 Tax=Chromobacterium TaxID=535 RepID=UPI001887131F|nr:MULTISPECIES: hypothetical protein [Chromobacterium]WON83881.1 hypothetical protein OK026_22660 [Chromobacterium haemolyticum]
MLKKLVFPALATTLMTFGVAASAATPASPVSHNGSAQISLLIEKTNVTSVPGLNFSLKTGDNLSHYQASINGVIGNTHSLPDFSFVATPNTGVDHPAYKTLNITAKLDTNSDKLNLSGGDESEYLQMTHKIQKTDNPDDFADLTSGSETNILSITGSTALAIKGQNFTRVIKTTLKPAPGKANFSEMAFGRYNGVVKLILSANWSDGV